MRPGQIKSSTEYFKCEEERSNLAPRLRAREGRPRLLTYRRPMPADLSESQWATIVRVVKLIQEHAPDADADVFDGLPSY
jgi:hypothetical protein